MWTCQQQVFNPAAVNPGHTLWRRWRWTRLWKRLLAFMLLIGKKIATIPCCSTYSRDRWRIEIALRRYQLHGPRNAPDTSVHGYGCIDGHVSVVNAVLLRPLPFREPNRLVQVAEKNDQLNLPTFGSSVLNLLDWREQSKSFDELAAVGFNNYTLTGTGERTRAAFRQSD
jgi:hypothetical protein